MIFVMRPLALLLLLLLPAAAAGQGLPGDPQAGAELASRLCAGCHDIGPGRSLMRISVAPAFQAIADRPITTSIGLRVFLWTPHADMPDIMLTPEQVDGLASYILSLQGR
jgi:mono/diheme cytochrome c family protein